MNDNKKLYQQIDIPVYLLTQDDVVRTSNGLEIDCSNVVGWGAGSFDSPLD